MISSYKFREDMKFDDRTIIKALLESPIITKGCYFYEKYYRYRFYLLPGEMGEKQACLSLIRGYLAFIETELTEQLKEHPSLPQTYLKMLIQFNG